MSPQQGTWAAERLWFRPGAPRSPPWAAPLLCLGSPGPQPGSDTAATQDTSVCPSLPQPTCALSDRTSSAAAPGVVSYGSHLLSRCSVPSETASKAFWEKTAAPPTPTHEVCPPLPHPSIAKTRHNVASSQVSGSSTVSCESLGMLFPAEPPLLPLAGPQTPPAPLQQPREAGVRGAGHARPCLCPPAW